MAKIEEVKLKVRKQVTHVNEVTVKNSFRVPLATWRAWTPKAKHVFNTVYYTMKNNQFAFHHPKQKMMVDEHWDTTCYNAAFTAADAVKSVEDQ